LSEEHDKTTAGKGDGGETPQAEEGKGPETLEEALAELTKARHDAAQNHDRWLRAAAETENVRRRCEREKSDYLKYATERLVRDLLPVVDNLERALEHSGGADNNQALQRGVELTLKGLKDALEGHGVVAVEALGRPFDPNLHEAVSVEERPGVSENEVVGELQRGYLLRDRLLRPAMVIVAKAAQEGSLDEGGPEDAGPGEPREED
jgi:molecular chaperone GrpE